MSEHLALYLTAGDRLYAVNAGDGTTRWRQQVKLSRTREVVYPPEVSVPPPHWARFATPRVEGGDDGVVYVVCQYGFGSHTCAFAADNGALRWWTPTDAQVASMPFQDFAVPLVHDGIVYSGSYALSERDGSVLRRIATDIFEEGTLSLHALVDETLYASTTRGIYSINVQDGKVRWRYQPEESRQVSGPPVVSGRLLYVGTNATVGYPPMGHCFALDVETGAEVWRYPMGGYVGAVVQRET
ncbi:MAG: PQQ-binding-like beta-propeller repeat protein, partial [Ktedonobacterales bacterium]